MAEINPKNESDNGLLKPHMIKQKLDEYVIGQAEAKKILSVAVYNHYKRLYSSFIDSVEIEKSNVLLIGPTGCGKTLLAKTLAKILDVPYAITDATTVTEAGYVGEDVENILLQLVQAASYDIKKAEKGIIYIDEIDKIGKKTDNVSITRDVSGEGVQQALLKIIEGTIAKVPPKGGRKHPQQEYLEIDTSNILFSCGGAFIGIDEILNKKKHKSKIGFKSDNSSDSKYYQTIEPKDLIQFGLIPEFIGRLPVYALLKELNAKELEYILTKPKNALLKQYTNLFALDGVKFSYEIESVKTLANLAIKRKIGARGLRSILEKILLDIMYEIPMNNKIDSFNLTEQYIKRKIDILDEKKTNLPTAKKKKAS